MSAPSPSPAGAAAAAGAKAAPQGDAKAATRQASVALPVPSASAEDAPASPRMKLSWARSPKGSPKSPPLAPDDLERSRSDGAARGSGASRRSGADAAARGAEEESDSDADEDDDDRGPARAESKSPPPGAAEDADEAPRPINAKVLKRLRTLFRVSVDGTAAIEAASGEAASAAAAPAGQQAAGGSESKAADAEGTRRRMPHLKIAATRDDSVALPPRPNSARLGGDGVAAGAAGAAGTLSARRGGVADMLEPLSARSGRRASEAEDDGIPANEIKDSPEHEAERANVLTEILESERRYVQSVTLLVCEFLVPIEQQKLYRQDPAATFVSLLSASQAILSLHQRMLKDLEALLRPLAAADLLPVFLKYVDFLKVYTTYVQNYPHVMRDLTNDEAPRALLNLLANACAEHRVQGITQLLIAPVQRVARYGLLLERLHKHTPEFHPAMLATKTALRKSRVVAARVDECQKESESAYQLFFLQRTVRGLPSGLRLVVPSRMFWRTGVVTDATNAAVLAAPPTAPHPHRHSVRIFLFNDLILLTSMDYQYLRSVDLEMAVELQQPAQNDCALSIMSGVDGSTLEATLLFASAADRAQWQSELQRAIDTQIANLNSLTRRQVGTVTSRNSLQQQLLAAQQAAGGAGGAGNVSVEQVNLFLRVRPLVTEEEQTSRASCVQINDNLATVTVEEKDKRWERVGAYDMVFGPDDDQSAVFQRVGEETLGALFAGYNAVIFAYGSTGAGKTYTMFGDTSGADPKRAGLIPRMLEGLFAVINTPGAYTKTDVELSFVQVYNNELYDLQSDDPNPQNLSVKKSSKFHTVKGLSKRLVSSAKEALAAVDEGFSRRATRATRLNDMSSRSHAVLRIKLELQRAGEEKELHASLFLIDLAGSENALESGVEGEALVECKFINQSLSALGRVVTTLVENKEHRKKQPVPFRETKLTHLLIDILSGDFVLSVILNVSPSPLHGQALLTAKTIAFGAGMKRLSIAAKQHVQQPENQVVNWLTGMWKSIARSVKS